MAQLVARRIPDPKGGGSNPSSFKSRQNPIFFILVSCPSGQMVAVSIPMDVDHVKQSPWPNG